MLMKYRNHFKEKLYLIFREKIPDIRKASKRLDVPRGTLSHIIRRDLLENSSLRMVFKIAIKVDLRFCDLTTNKDNMNLFEEHIRSELVKIWQEEFVIIHPKSLLDGVDIKVMKNMIK